jgi:hypothetical protein
VGVFDNVYNLHYDVQLEDDMMMLHEVISELKDIGEELSKDSKSEDRDGNEHGGWILTS